jgi:hypothetical protein
MPQKKTEERVILCVEASRDLERIVSLLANIGIEGVACAHISELCDQINLLGQVYRQF